MAATLPAESFPAKKNMAKSASGGDLPPRQRRLPWADAAFSFAAHAAAIVTLGLLAAIIISLVIGAWPAINEYGLSFLWRSEWDPVEDRYGGLVMIYGTLATSVIALLIAVPVSFGIALFLTELSPGWLRRPLGTAIELLAAVPSIVYGMWGLLVFGPILAKYVQTPLQNAFGDVPVLGALFSGAPVGIGILSAGGHFTMDMARAAWAARRYFNFRTVIPCHYRTFPILEQTAEALRRGLPPDVHVIEPEVLMPIRFGA